MDTRAVLRDFRRSFHRARTAFAPFEQAGGVVFEIKWTPTELKSEATGPGAEDVTRFLVVMRRFLVSDDRLHVAALYRLGHELGALQEGSQESHLVAAQLARMARGDFGFVSNSESLDAENLYRKIAAGGFFESDPTAENFVKTLFEVPGAETLARFAFVNYAVRAFQVLDLLFQLFHREGLFAPQDVEAERRCIYCLSSAGTFTSEEHVFPEGLGNDEIVLPLGIVCDRCNNGHLAQLDHALLSFPPIAFLAVQFVPHTKEGKLPAANFQNLKMEKTAPLHLRLTAKDKTGEFREVEQLSDGRTRFNVEIKGQRFDPRLLGRALFKIGLGLVALEEGPEVARTDRFAAAREFVTLDRGFENNVVIRSFGEPNPRVSAIRYASLPGTTFAFDIFGVVMLVNLETEPTIDVTPELAFYKFVAHSLAPRVGVRQPGRRGRKTAGPPDN